MVYAIVASIKQKGQRYNRFHANQTSLSEKMTTRTGSQSQDLFCSGTIERFEAQLEKYYGETDFKNKLMFSCIAYEKSNDIHANCYVRFHAYCYCSLA